MCISKILNDAFASTTHILPNGHFLDWPIQNQLAINAADIRN